MPRFQFRMQKLLDHRLRLEAAAKDQYLLARSRRLAAEDEKDRLALERLNLASQPCLNLGDMVQKQAALARLGDEEEQMASAISVLFNEEEAAKERYFAAKRDAEAIEKLRERAHDEWQKEENKREQAEIDEWAVTRRAA